MLINTETGTPLVECPLGFYDPERKAFYLTQAECDDPSNDYDYLDVAGYEERDGDDGCRTFRLIKKLTPEEVADCISIYHKEVSDARPRN